MRTLLNIIWFVFSGFWLWAHITMLAGIICCVLIMLLPWGVASFRMASYAAWPFGRELVDSRTPGSSPFSAMSSGLSSPAGGSHSASPRESCCASPSSAFR